MITPLPGITETKPGSATVPFPGITAEVLTAEGDTAGAGYLAITKPWPGMLRTIWGDDERFRRTTGRAGTASTSRATARSATRTATTGSSAASMTC
jgi:acyl-coenzyme A synthetase/AMP-(fatty) acid ligase